MSKVPDRQYSAMGTSCFSFFPTTFQELFVNLYCSYKVFCHAPSLKKTREDASIPANQGFIKPWHHHVGRAFVGHRLQHGGAQALSITEQAAVCCKGELHVWRFCGKRARHVSNGLGVVSLHVVLLLSRQRLYSFRRPPRPINTRSPERNPVKVVKTRHVLKDSLQKKLVKSIKLITWIFNCLGQVCKPSFHKLMV